MFGPPHWYMQDIKIIDVSELSDSGINTDEEAKVASIQPNSCKHQSVLIFTLVTFNGYATISGKVPFVTEELGISDSDGRKIYEMKVICISPFKENFLGFEVSFIDVSDLEARHFIISIVDGEIKFTRSYWFPSNFS